MRAVLVLLAACGGGGVAAPDAGGPIDVDGFDLIASAKSVLVYPRFKGATHGQFPREIGDGGSYGSDGIVSFESTLTDVSIDGVVVDGARIPGYRDNNPISAGGITADTMFRATDSQIAIAVPLHVGPYVAASDVAANASGSDLVVTWTVGDVDSVFVTSGNGYGLYGARVAASPASYAIHNVDNVVLPLQIEVQPFSTPETTETELGTVRVFYGEATSISYGGPSSQ